MLGFIPQGYGLSISILTLYFAGTMFVGLYAWKKFPQGDAESFIVGGRGVGWIVTAFCLMATQYSALTVLGFPGTMYRTGLAGYVAIVGGYLSFAALYWLIFGARTWKVGRAFGHVTPGETFSHYYGSQLVGYVLAGMLLLTLIPYIQLQILGLGFLFEVATGGLVGFTAGAIFVYVMIIVYTFLGGLRAVALTDTLQGVLLLGGIVGGALLIASAAGGIGASFEAVRTSAPALFTVPGPTAEWPWLYLISWALPVGLGWTMHPHMWLRMHIPRTVNFIRMWPMWIAISYPIVMGSALLSGVAAQVLRPGVTSRVDTDTVMISLILEHFPVAIAGLIAAAGIAAMMSTVSGQIHAVGASVSRDFIEKVLPEGTRQGVLFVRLSILGVGVIGLFLSLTTPTFLTTLGAFAAAWGAQAAPAAIAALAAWSRATKWGAIVGAIGGSVTLLAIGLGMPGQQLAGVYAGAWGLAVNVTLFVLVSAATQSARPSEEIVRKYQALGW